MTEWLGQEIGPLPAPDPPPPPPSTSTTAKKSKAPLVVGLLILGGAMLVLWGGSR